jgi:hypothetical protein
MASEGVNSAKPSRQPERADGAAAADNAADYAEFCLPIFARRLRTMNATFTGRSPKRRMKYETLSRGALGEKVKEVPRDALEHQWVRPGVASKCSIVRA